MPDLRDISIGSRYTGESAIGGGGFGVLQIDTRPLQQLAAYTFEYNRVAFQQRQKDFEAKALELADLTSYDLTTAIPEDRKKIQQGYDELYKYVQENPNVLDYKNNPKGWMEYNKKKNDFENKLRGGKVRSVLYSARDKEVSETKNPGLKAIYKKNLDDEARSTDLDTPLKHTQLWEIAAVKVEPPPSQKFDVTSIGANFLGTRTWELPDMDSVEAQAVRIKMGLDIVDTNSDEFRKKSPKDQELIIAERDAQVASGRLEPVKSAEALNAILQSEKYKQPEFRNSDGSLNIDAVKADNAGNGLVTGSLSSIQQYNAKMDEMTKAIDAGYFQDKFGKQLSFGAGGLNRDKYRKIEIKDGVSPEEILKPRILGLAKPPESSTKVTELDLKRGYLDLAKFNARTARINANKDGGGDKASSIVIDKPAILFGEHINRLKNAFQRNGGKELPIRFDEIDEKTKSALKIEAGEAIVYRPDGSFIVRDVNGKQRAAGTIDNIAQGFIDAVRTTDIPAGADKDGTMTEGFQIKSEAKFKELFGTSSGKYIWDNWPTKEQSAKQTETPTEELDPNGFKKEGKYYRYKDGTLYDADGNIVNKK